MQLCPCYLSALTKDLLVKNTSDIIFYMPNLTPLITNALQLEALRKVRRHASKQFTDLLKQKEKTTVKLRGLNNSTHRGQSLHTGT